MRWQRFTCFFGRCGHLLLMLLVCLYPLLPSWFDPRLPATHEGYRYLLLSDLFSDALASGVWYPRWIPEMNGGFGYPEFIFYQPAYFFVNAFISFGIEPLLLRQLLTLSLIALIGGLGVYYLARCYVAPARAVLLVLCFQMAPYVHTDLYLRGDLSEWMVVELLGWPIYFLLQFCREGDNSKVLLRFAWWIGLVLSTTVVCYSHPVGLMFLPPFLLFIGCVLVLSSRHSRRVQLTTGGELAAAVAIGLALSSPYWLTVMMMKPLVNVNAALDGFAAWENTVPLSQLLFGSLMNGKDFFEFLGAPFVAAAVVGWWVGRRTPLIFAAGLFYAIMLVLMTPYGQYLWKIYPLSLLQFPWRLAVFAPVLQIICFAGFYPKDGLVPIGRSWLIGGVALLVCWSLVSHSGFNAVEDTEPTLRVNQKVLACLRNFVETGAPGRYVSTLDAGEWMPLTAGGIGTVSARGQISSECDTTRQIMTSITAKVGMADMFFLSPISKPLIEVQQQGWSVQQNPAHTPFRLDYHVVGATPTWVFINQLYLRGWKIMVNTKELSPLEIERDLLPDGRMQIFLPPGEWHIQAWYDGPPGWQIRNWLIVVLCCFAIIYWSCRCYGAGEFHEN